MKPPATAPAVQPMQPDNLCAPRDPRVGRLKHKQRPLSAPVTRRPISAKLPPHALTTVPNTPLTQVPAASSPPATRSATRMLLPDAPVRGGRVPNVRTAAADAKPAWSRETARMRHARREAEVVMRRLIKSPEEDRTSGNQNLQLPMHSRGAAASAVAMALHNHATSLRASSLSACGSPALAAALAPTPEALDRFDRLGDTCKALRALADDAARAAPAPMPRPDIAAVTVVPFEPPVGVTAALPFGHSSAKSSSGRPPSAPPPPTAGNSNNNINNAVVVAAVSGGSKFARRALSARRQAAAAPTGADSEGCAAWAAAQLAVRQNKLVRRLSYDEERYLSVANTAASIIQVAWGSLAPRIRSARIVQRIWRGCYARSRGGICDRASEVCMLAWRCRSTMAAVRKMNAAPRASRQAAGLSAAMVLSGASGVGLAALPPAPRGLAAFADADADQARGESNQLARAVIDLRAELARRLPALRHCRGFSRADCAWIETETETLAAMGETLRKICN